MRRSGLPFQPSKASVRHIVGGTSTPLVLSFVGYVKWPDKSDRFVAPWGMHRALWALRDRDDKRKRSGRRDSNLNTLTGAPNVSLERKRSGRRDSNLHTPCGYAECLAGKEKGAGDGIRTRECQLGRLMPYHLATPARGLNYTKSTPTGIGRLW